MRYIRPPALDVSDATAVANKVLSPYTFYAGTPELKVGTITEATDLSAVDADLAPGNIRAGITIFSKIGADYVRDISEGDALIGEVKNGKKFFSVTGAVKTGTLPTRTLNPANSTVEEGFYVATTLEAVDGDLVTGNIKSGITIFGVAGSAAVQDISDSDASVGDVNAGKTFYSVTGGRKTGTLVADVYELLEDVGDKATSTTKTDTGSGTFWRKDISVAALTEVDVPGQTITKTYATDALVFSTAWVCLEGNSDIELRLYMDGVLMQEVNTLTGVTRPYSLVDFKVMSGSKICKGALYNNNVSTTRHAYFYAEEETNSFIAAGISVGSAKMVIT